MLCIPVDDPLHIPQAEQWADLIEVPTRAWMPLCTKPVLLKERSIEAADTEERGAGMTIRSYHNFDGVPHDLDAHYDRLRATPATFYKIAVTPHSSLEALSFWVWARAQPHLIPVAMGPYGMWSRCIAPALGAPMHYACLDKPLAPGQLTAELLCTRYRIQQTSPKTALYALLGDPIDKSPGDIFHNQKWSEVGDDAVYVSLRCSADELPAALPLLATLGFRGCSVTMPLKKAIVPLLDRLDPAAQAIGAVNTLVRDGKKWVGYNTDGLGALDALGPVAGLHLLIFGTGATAQAIQHESKRRGAQVTLCGRGEWPRLHHVHYDILVNATPAPPPSPCHLDVRHGHTLSYRFFCAQALRQRTLWGCDR